MFKKNKKQTENVKEKKVRTVKVGTHKKTVIALWVVLITSVSFGVYKNFTAIDQHTTHEKEVIELRLQDTNGIENFVKNFAKSYYTWNNSKEAIEARTQAISGYLTKELQDLNGDTIRTDIPTSSTVTDVIVWSIEQLGTDTLSATYEVDQQIKEGEQTSKLKRVVKGIVRNYRKELKRRRNKEISYCELPEIVVEKLAVWDEYESDYTAFDVCGIEVRVLDDDLAEAIKYLSEKDREILLMYFFLGMSDTEIGDRLKINRSTSFRSRKNSLEEIKKKLKENMNDE